MGYHLQKGKRSFSNNQQQGQDQDQEQDKRSFINNQQQGQDQDQEQDQDQYQDQDNRSHHPRDGPLLLLLPPCIISLCIDLIS
jgi:hypothetical protein